MNKENNSSPETENNSVENENASAERLFTQEEVSDIVRKRLSRVKEDHEAAVADAVKERTAELDARESRLNCRDYLSEMGYPAGLMDALPTADLDEFKKRADAVMGVFKSVEQNRVAPLGSLEPIMTGVSPIHQAFSRDNKHVPKQY